MGRRLRPIRMGPGGLTMRRSTLKIFRLRQAVYLLKNTSVSRTFWEPDPSSGDPATDLTPRRCRPRYSLRADGLQVLGVRDTILVSTLAALGRACARHRRSLRHTHRRPRHARTAQSPAGTAPVLVPRAGPPTGSPGLLLPSAKLHNSSSSDSNPALFLRAVRAARKSSSPTLRALITSSAACPELDVPPCSVTTAP